ncbi:hypothetical protein EB796_012406 [Bugula neritina]|uniref:Uncharacterized protein n=1 Tax=Bugula neritina TaxID=10212 RepID=A0A7J7JTG8_BUGNE|nr:hypothetical protein EB796_012406 [Bugula neritina]
MEDISQENSELRGKCEKFEKSNQSLMAQLARLQNIVKKLSPQPTTAQTGICLAVRNIVTIRLLGSCLLMVSVYTPSLGVIPSILTSYTTLIK